MSGSTIGIKVADGSYYPVLPQGFTGRKTLTLTTVNDNQTRVQIDLYRGDGGGLAEASYVGSLIIESIPPAPRGEPEISLSLGLDEAGELDAEASDISTGESQKFSIRLKTLSDEETYEIPEFRVEGDGEPAAAAAEIEEVEGSLGSAPSDEEGPEEFDFEEPALTGESYPGSATRAKAARGPRRGPGTFLIVLFCLLGALLLAVVGYVVYRSVTGDPIELFPGSQAGSAAGAQPGEPPATGAAVEQGQQPPEGGQAVTPAATTDPAPTAAAEPPAVAPEKPAASAAKDGLTYRIRKGDTLWDIASTYYRNPWLYPRLARANSIKNPDLIFAGTKILIPED